MNSTPSAAERPHAARAGRTARPCAAARARGVPALAPGADHPARGGHPARPRRRTPGLRREEVAQLSGVSVTWYTWLEQARDISVSRQVLESLARALMLDAAERRHLFALAGEPLPGRPPADGPPPALQRLVDALDPHPAYCLDVHWNLVAWNRAEAALIGDPARLEPRARNLLRLMFTDPRLRTLVADWPGQARRLLAQFRADARQRIGDPHLERLTGELRQESPEFAAWWESHDVADFHANRRTFHHPRGPPRPGLRETGRAGHPGRQALRLHARGRGDRREAAGADRPSGRRPPGGR
ncbi:helix-turn-helix transcriptional regulator [Streptomyces stramineus]